VPKIQEFQARVAECAKLQWYKCSACRSWNVQWWFQSWHRVNKRQNWNDLEIWIRGPAHEGHWKW